MRLLRLIDFSPREKVQDWHDGDLGSSPDLSTVLETIGFEMARPVGPSASETEYVPTQYVAEVIRAAQYDGATFKSALGPGTSIVLFSQEDASVGGVELRMVEEVNYVVADHEYPPL